MKKKLKIHKPGSARMRGLNASGFLSKIADIACCRSISCIIKLAQSKQLHPLQYCSTRKQSQYNFKHRLFLQLHVTNLLLPGDGALTSAFEAGLGEGSDSVISCLEQISSFT